MYTIILYEPSGTQRVDTSMEDLAKEVFQKHGMFLEQYSLVVLLKDGQLEQYQAGSTSWPF